MLYMLKQIKHKPFLKFMNKFYNLLLLIQENLLLLIKMQDWPKKLKLNPKLKLKPNPTVKLKLILIPKFKLNLKIKIKIYTKLLPLKNMLLKIWLLLNLIEMSLLLSKPSITLWDIKTKFLLSFHQLNKLNIFLNTKKLLLVNLSNTSN